MPKKQKRSIAMSVWVVRAILLAIFLAIAVATCATLLGETETVNTNNEVLKNEKAESESEPAVPAAGVGTFADVSDTSQPAVTDTSCLLVKAVNGVAPDVLTVDNTVRIPPRLCLSFILGISEAVSRGLLEPKDLLYETL